MIKIVVDIRRRILAGGGEMHSDCESVLLDEGSELDDLWCATGILLMRVKSGTPEILGGV